ncbi:tail fiber assembly protein, partial [Salmonella enterica subsp. enterica serovar Weltevreden]|uniref:tail fiber assembly protein n=1 Tax=Salmonella enterica TaxID=28901 RepID=UPI001F2F0042
FRCLDEAESAIAPRARAVKLKIATDDESKRLEAWELYSVMVNWVDTSAPDWPDIPRSRFRWVYYPPFRVPGVVPAP